MFKGEKRMRRVLVSGYYGFNNAGDEAILKALIEGIRGAQDECEIVVLSQHPRFTAQKHNVKSAMRMNIFRLLWEIKKCDLLISGGGSLLQDVTSKRSILYYLAIIYAAKLMGKSVMIYSQGIGPVSRSSNRRFLKKALSMVDFINVRDEKSKSELQEMGIDNEILVTADAVFGMSRPSLDKGAAAIERLNIKKGKRLVGISMRPWKDNDEISEKFSQLCKSMAAEQGCEIVLLPFHFYSDLEIMDMVYQKLDSETRKSVHVLREYLHVEDYLSLIGNLDMFIGMRLHGLIFSVLMGVPVVGISYDPKIDSFMSSIGKKSTTDVLNLNFNDIINEVEKILLNFDTEKGLMDSRAIELSAKVKNHNMALGKLIKSSGQRWDSIEKAEDSRRANRQS
ncbi:pyruvyl-transferase CsaB [Peptoclostridium acidaminophilum DSM 3953]|uniref:Pyruvyl-transferase CsaB n=2 Tax=Peptoclostridium acidaminophilum TaxID=1731 RepID=W8T4G0_PEPAC|nr:pyruvyl-transferase CsaB [Peptoclostridium acidaminophilum DSM 3953]